jgi:hypothetical protein
MLITPKETSGEAVCWRADLHQCNGRPIVAGYSNFPRLRDRQFAMHSRESKPPGRVPEMGGGARHPLFIRVVLPSGSA